MNSSGHDQHETAHNDQPPLRDGTPLGTGEDQHLLAYQRRNARILWTILILLLMLAAGVFFILPDYVGNPTISTETVPPPSPRPAGSSEEQGEAISPFEEAQRMRQRETAQEILGQLLELQEGLEQHGVEQWAAERYAEALSQAEAGDSAYREQDFVTATERYRESLAGLEALEADRPRILSEQLEKGRQAIRDGQPGEARSAFELAMVIAPDSVEADNGLRRAQVLDEVLALNEEADALRETGELEAARERYQEALALDSEHAGTRQKLEAVESAIEERRFTRLMSQGYAALSGNDPTSAEDFFQQALSVRPGASEATSALEQARERITSNAISRHLETARAHEAAEEWQQALDAYQQALDVDPNVVAAKEGLQRARSRRNLDDFLTRLLDDPLRLADEAVYEESRDIYLNALRIPDAGPRLREQLRQAEFYLEQARIPRDVRLISDGMTRVTVLRVENLGQFDETTLALTPGRYVATGIRTGYRDVRREFVVPFEGEPPRVTVICEESIR